MKNNNNFNLTHSLLQTVREVVAQEANMTGKKAIPKKKESTVMIAHGTGGGVKVIPKSQYNPKKHTLADEKEPMAAPVAKVDTNKADKAAPVAKVDANKADKSARRKAIAKTIEKKKKGIKLSGKAEFVDVKPKVNESAANEAITRNTPTSDVVKDFVNSKDPKFAGKSKADRVRMALGASYAKKRK